MGNEEIQIIYEHGKPFGIRDKGGYLLFFKNVSKYHGQHERYINELEEQRALADYLLNALEKRVVGSEVRG